MTGRSCEGKALSPLEVVLVLTVFSTCLAGACLLPYELCPDEGGRQLLSDWIYRTGALPTGNETETIIQGYGFSYALRPYLSAIIAALLMRVASLVSTSPHVLLVASRMVSVLSVTGCCLFCLGFGHAAFSRHGSAVIFAGFVCLMPQVLFLGMYQNCDALSLAATSAVLYYLVRCHDRHWDVGSCVGLATSLSVGILSYYSIYGWLLAAGGFCVVGVLGDGAIENRWGTIQRRAALVVGICLALTGWFFVRNALLHGGDFLGIVSEGRQRVAYAAQGNELGVMRSMRNEGYSPLGFLTDARGYWPWLTMISFIGVFGNMDILMPQWWYAIYLTVFALGIVLYVVAVTRQRPSRRDALLVVTMLVASCISLFLHFWASYARDYQPQGRYVITVVMLLAYLFAYGADRLTILRDGVGRHAAAREPGYGPAVAFCALWLCLFAIGVAMGMSRMLL